MKYHRFRVPVVATAPRTQQQQSRWFYSAWNVGTSVRTTTAATSTAVQQQQQRQCWRGTQLPVASSKFHPLPGSTNTNCFHFSSAPDTNRNYNYDTSKFSIQPGSIVPIYIGGIPTMSSSTNTNTTTLPVRDKYTGKEYCKVTLADTEMIERATHIAATVGRDKMRALLPYQRQDILYCVVQQMKDRREELAYTITLEVGKTISDALMEVDRCIQTFILSGEETTRIHGTTMDYQYAPRMTGFTGYTKRYPIGPISCIAPFNFPLNLVAHKIAPAIAAGCSFVLKPASKTPLSALLLGELLVSTRNPTMPKEGFSIVPCHRDVGNVLIHDDRYKLVTFTGSSEVGFHHVKPNAGKKPVVLECGGTAYCIINDIEHIAKIDSTINDITAGAFYQSGQSCISIQHILIHESIYDTIKYAIIEKTRKLIVGDPYDPNTNIGPVISEESAIRIESWIDEAVTAGATIVCGTGKCYNHSFIAPTIVEDVPHHCQLYHEEIFGPVVCIEKYTNFDDAVALVNASKYGLQTGIYTNNNQYIQNAFDMIDCGGICINTPPSTRIDAQPYGGVKDSGIGREGIQYTIENYTELKVLIMKQTY